MNEVSPTYLFDVLTERQSLVKKNKTKKLSTNSKIPHSVFGGKGNAI